jgi:hypothetical protein
MIQDTPRPRQSECVRERCYQAVWLTGTEYNQTRANPQWAVVIPGYRVDLAQCEPTVGTVARNPHPLKQLVADIPG